MRQVRYHQIAAVSFWLTGLFVVIGWGRSVAVESAPIRAEREQLEGTWVATSVRVGSEMALTEQKGLACVAEFSGGEVHFKNLIDQPGDSRGEVTLDHQGGTHRVDFWLDCGWIIGVYECDGSTLKLAINPLAPGERLGVAIRPRPKKVEAGAGCHYYEFRRVSPRL